MMIILWCILLACAQRTQSLVPNGPEWRIKDTVVADAEKTITLFFRHTQPSVLESVLMKVSDPKSPHYGNYMSKTEVQKMIAVQGKEEVIRWLSKLPGDVEDLGDTLEWKTSVRSVESAFSTSLCRYEHPTGQEAILSCPYNTLAIPAPISAFIGAIDGITHFPLIKTPRPPRQTDISYNVPASIKQLYNISSDVRTSLPQGVMGYSEVGYGIFADLESFSSLNNVDVPNLQIVGSLSNYSTNIYLSVESNLDIQYISGMASGATTYYFTAAATSLKFVSILNQMEDPPLVNSISFGTAESKFTESELEAMSQELIKLGLRGITIVVASGDAGILGANYDCRGDPNAADYFQPSFPATSPFVTSVGATSILGSHSAIGREMDGTICDLYNCTQGYAEEIPAVNENADFTTGGGFSQFYTARAYQQDAVDEYLKTANKFPPTHQWNRNHRAFPDLSATGQNLIMVNDTKVMINGGTSGSAPIIAGVFTLLNDFLLANGHPQLGFANPLLYQMARECPNCFKGMSENVIGEFEDRCSLPRFECCVPQGFQSASTRSASWDPLTGLGTLDFGTVQSYLASLHHGRK